jgi:hypothetical protein
LLAFSHRSLDGPQGGGGQGGAIVGGGGAGDATLLAEADKPDDRTSKYARGHYRAPQGMVHRARETRDRVLGAVSSHNGARESILVSFTFLRFSLLFFSLCLLLFSFFFMFHHLPLLLLLFAVAD